jgi:thiamine kinase-like enzyme
MNESKRLADTVARVEQLGCWSSAVSPKPLTGGITNTNFVVEDAGQNYVVRLGDDLPLHGIVRAHEVAASRAAHAIGVAPEIIFNEPGVLVMRFIEGNVLTSSDIANAKTLDRLVALLRRCHNELPEHLNEAEPKFSVFPICSNYLNVARVGNSRISSKLESLDAMTVELQECIGEIETVFCHNDLLSSNFIDDGNRIWLIDWEYAGYNSAVFDLANLSTNSELSEELEIHLLTAYYGHDIDEQTIRRFRAFKCASLLRETLWSVVQEIHSHLDFDYASYTDEQFSRLEKAYDKFRS